MMGGGSFYLQLVAARWRGMDMARLSRISTKQP
jgi:hypothetical protein